MIVCSQYLIYAENTVYQCYSGGFANWRNSRFPSFWLVDICKWAGTFHQALAITDWRFFRTAAETLAASHIVRGQILSTFPLKKR